MARRLSEFDRVPGIRKVAGKDFVLTAYSYDRPGTKLRAFLSRVKKRSGSPVRVYKGKLRGKTIRYIYTKLGK